MSSIPAASRFASLIGGALVRRSAADVGPVLAELEATPALADDEEPDGVGFTRSAPL